MPVFKIVDNLPVKVPLMFRQQMQQPMQQPMQPPQFLGYTQQPAYTPAQQFPSGSMPNNNNKICAVKVIRKNPPKIKEAAKVEPKTKTEDLTPDENDLLKDIPSDPENGIDLG